MKISKQVENAIKSLNRIEDEVLRADLQEHVQAAYGHLEEVMLELQEVKL